MFRKQPPPPPKSDTDDQNPGTSEEEEHERPASKTRKRNNNQIEKRESQDSDDEVFHHDEIEVIKEEKEHETKIPESKKNAGLRNRRVSYGKIPVPPMPLTVEDIQEAAKNSREAELNETDGPKPEKRKSLDPRRSSVSVDVFKGFRDPHDKENIPAKNKTVYVEGTNGKFREMKKGKFWRKNPDPRENNMDDEEEESIIPYLLRAPGQAFRTQRAYNQIANIIQGFLAGITVMLAIFSFNLEPEVLLSGYRVMSLPIHAAFYIAFTVGFVSAIDRTGIYEVEHFTSVDRLKATVYNNGLFTFVVWFVGMIATLLCIQLESQLAFAPDEIPTDTLVQQWRVYNVFRALSAAFGFLLLAFKPDSDTMAKELRRAIFEHLEKVTHDHENKEIILAAMKIHL